ncbi:hypothetical protein M752DRAFT_264007 [Aspergillus phoenicis ATCC 13157]|uniref:Uncharacterized protein n=1 Tax=Aspergillus phoenicis ATCC 13157 TaxID=1353007 RepID=A0A370PSL2_ASPPH|nr:hypothetical protein M752DRAFT_264007 [Aspergillus phoenicis ATCC 13157]
MSKKRERYERDEEIENVEEVAFRKQKEQQQQQQQQSKLSSSAAAAAADLLTNKSVSQSVMSRSGKFTRIWYGRYKQSTEWYLGGLGLTQLGISGTTLRVGRLVAATGMIITVFLGTEGGKKYNTSSHLTTT